MRRVAAVTALGLTLGGCCLPATRSFACVEPRPYGLTPVCRNESHDFAECGGDEETSGVMIPVDGYGGGCIEDTSCADEGFTDDCGNGLWAEWNRC
jgi:hypothetical protein